MTYDNPPSLRMALEQRLLNQSRQSGISIDRLRRRVLFERIVARLHHAEPGRWVLKGGMAMEVRVSDRARLTKDIDLGLRVEAVEGEELHERVVEALTVDPFDDQFTFNASAIVRLLDDEAGHPTWRCKGASRLAGKPFGTVQLDISPRLHELDKTDLVALPNSLAFAGIESTSIEIIDVNRHAAEKLHAMQKDFGERQNSRVRDLVDLMIFCELDLLDLTTLADAVIRVWSERNGITPPVVLSPLPTNWHERYEQLALDHGLETTSFSEAVTKTNTHGQIPSGATRPVCSNSSNNCHCSIVTTCTNSSHDPMRLLFFRLDPTTRSPSDRVDQTPKSALWSIAHCSSVRPSRPSNSRTPGRTRSGSATVSDQ